MRPWLLKPERPKPALHSRETVTERKPTAHSRRGAPLPAREAAGAAAETVRPRIYIHGKSLLEKINWKYRIPT